MLAPKTFTNSANVFFIYLSLHLLVFLPFDVPSYLISILLLLILVIFWTLLRVRDILTLVIVLLLVTTISVIYKILSSMVLLWMGITNSTRTFSQILLLIILKQFLSTPKTMPISMIMTLFKLVKQLLNILLKSTLIPLIQPLIKQHWSQSKLMISTMFWVPYNSHLMCAVSMNWFSKAIPIHKVCAGTKHILWYQRLGHTCDKFSYSANKFIDGLPELKQKSDIFLQCSTCFTAKMTTSASVPNSDKRAIYFEKICPITFLLLVLNPRKLFVKKVF